MKRPQPDIGETLKNNFIGNLKTVRSLLRLWGTEMVNGVEVFTPRQYYYPNGSRSANFEKLFKFLGAYDDVVEGKYEGIRSAWFYFNKNNGTELVGSYNDFVADNLNKMWWDDNDGPMPQGLTLTTSIAIEGYSNNSVDNDRIQQLINTSMPESTAITSIQNNYEELWNLCKITQEGVGIINKGSITDPVNKITVPDEDDLSPDDPWLNVIARYALRNSGLQTTIKKLTIGTIQKNNGPYKQDFYTTYVLDIEIPYVLFSSGNSTVNQIVDDLTTTGLKDVGTNKFLTSKAIKTMDATDLEDDPDLVTRSYILWEDQGTIGSTLTDSLWYNFNGTWYLRAEPFRNPRAFGFKYSQLNTYILGLLDSGYQKKKAPWYKKALAILIVVVAVIVAVVSVGKGAKVSAYLIAVAKAVLTASLILTIAMLAFALTGQAEWASAFMEASKMIEPLVLVATIVLITTGITKAVESAKVAAEEAAKAAGEEFVERSTLEIALELAESRLTELATSFADSIIQGATDVFSANFFTDAALSFTTKLFKVINFGMNVKLESLQERNKDLKAEYEELVKEMNRETDTLQGFAQIYAKPATADWSIYAAEFDVPYERGGGFLSLGNVQRTTKQAMRKADYNDAIFADILVI